MASTVKKRKRRVWMLWAVIAPWGVRAVAGTKEEAAMCRFNNEDKLCRVRVSEVSNG